MSSSGTDHPETTEPRRRDRKRRTPLNVGVLGDTRGGMHSAKIARVGGEGNVESDLDPSTIYHMHHITQEVSLEEYYASSRDEKIATQLLERRCWRICEVQQGSQ